MTVGFAFLLYKEMYQYILAPRWCTPNIQVDLLSQRPAISLRAQNLFGAGAGVATGPWSALATALCAGGGMEGGRALHKMVTMLSMVRQLTDTEASTIKRILKNLEQGRLTEVKVEYVKIQNMVSIVSHLISYSFPFSRI